MEEVNTIFVFLQSLFPLHGVGWPKWCMGLAKDIGMNRSVSSCPLTFRNKSTFKEHIIFLTWWSPWKGSASPSLEEANWGLELPKPDDSQSLGFDIRQQT